MIAGLRAHLRFYSLVGAVFFTSPLIFTSRAALNRRGASPSAVAVEGRLHTDTQTCQLPVATLGLPPLPQNLSENAKVPAVDGVIDAVVMVIRNSRGELLVGERSGSSGAGTWGMPGGKVDPEDSGKVLTAARRELGEELGLTIQRLRWLHSAYVIDTYRERPQIFRVFVFEVNLNPKVRAVLEKKPKNFIREPHKMLQLGWYGLDHLPRPMFAATRQYWADLRKKL